MDDSINYQAVAEDLQREVEQLRLHILKMRYTARPFYRLNARELRKFVNENYLLILVSFMGISLTWSFVKPLISSQVFKHRSKDNAR